jgi:signal transduction histidine kinase
MFRSATFKMTVWYLAIVMVISIAFSFAVYHFATDELSFGLQHQMQRIFHHFPVFDGNPILKPQGSDIRSGAHHIIWQLIYFNFLVLIGAGFASFFLARRTLRPIETAHEQQKRFTADVSHELRTPLTSLKMGSEVALMDTQGNKKELREALESNLEDAAKMDVLINNLLRLTKLDTDGIHDQFGPVHIKQLIDAAIAQTRKVAELKHITVASTAKDIALVGDADSLTQLVVILLDNAIKYSPEGTTVHLETRHEDNNVEIIVKDMGSGITPEAMPHIFERFYRADSSRAKTGSEGYGLGLNIAKLIADKHTGSITLTSRVNQGTTAILRLPDGSPKQRKHFYLSTGPFTRHKSSKKTKTS